jgi:hypothetical protein
MFAGLRKPTQVIVLGVTLLAYGCPIQAIVHAFCQRRRKFDCVASFHAWVHLWDSRIVAVPSCYNASRDLNLV